jgi:hypothetical protein
VIISFRYQATDVVPPPEDYDFKTDQVSKGGGNSQTDWDYGAVITIEKGYQAIYATVSRVATIWEDDAVADVYVGTRSHRFAVKDGEWSWGAPLNNEIGSISWGFITFHVANIVLSVEIKCIVTQYAIDLWKADTHAKLLNAYKAQLQNYEDKLAALKLQSGPTIQGTYAISTVLQTLVAAESCQQESHRKPYHYQRGTKEELYLHLDGAALRYVQLPLHFCLHRAAGNQLRRSRS